MIIDRELECMILYAVGSKRQCSDEGRGRGTRCRGRKEGFRGRDQDIRCYKL